jgi:hypothetical protein
VADSNAKFFLIGVPTIVVLGRGLRDGVVELRDRASGARRDVPLADAVAELTSPLDPADPPDPADPTDPAQATGTEGASA